MNVATYQEKDKNKKTGKRKVGEERRQPTDFKEAACCPSAVVKGAARQKNVLFEGSARGNWNSREDQQPFRPKRGWGQHHHVQEAVDWCSLIFLALYTVYTTKISHFTIQKD